MEMELVPLDPSQWGVDSIEDAIEEADDDDNDNEGDTAVWKAFFLVNCCMFSVINAVHCVSLHTVSYNILQSL